MEKDSAGKNISLLEDRIRFLLETEAAKELYYYLKNLNKYFKKNELHVIATGSGGSYTSAFF